MAKLYEVVKKGTFPPCMSLPAPFNLVNYRVKTSEVNQNILSSLGPSNRTWVSLCRDMVKAVLTVAKDDNNGCLIQVTDDVYASERHHLDGSSDLFVYNMNTGVVNAATLSVTGAYFPFDLKRDSLPLAGLYTVLLPEFLQKAPKNEAEDAFDAIQQGFGTASNDDMLAKMLLLNDSFYYHIKLNSKLRIPDDHNLEMLFEKEVASGKYVGRLISGESKYFMAAKSKHQKVNKAVTLKDAKAMFKSMLPKRTWSDEQKAFIPELPENYVVPEEVIEMCRQFLASQKLFDEPIHNFHWSAGTALGKSTGIKMMGAILNMPVRIITCNPMTEAMDFISSFVPVSNDKPQNSELPDFETIAYDPETAYEMLTGENPPQDVTPDMVMKLRDAEIERISAEKSGKSEVRYEHVVSDYAKALIEGSIVEVQEASRIKNQGVLTALNEYNNTGAVIRLADGRYEKRHPSAIVVFTDNLGAEGFDSCNELEPSVNRRFDLKFSHREPTKEETLGRIKVNTGFNDKKLLDKMYNVYEKIQSYCKEHEIINGSCTAKELENWVKALMVNMELDNCDVTPALMRDTCIRAVVNKCSSFGDEQREIINSVLTVHLSAL